MWRMLLMPMDTCKTVLQVDSVTGFRNLMRKVKAGQIQVLYQGELFLILLVIFFVSFAPNFTFVSQVQSPMLFLLLRHIILGSTHTRFYIEVALYRN
jgi:uncharacterized integral membrane protein